MKYVIIRLTAMALWAMVSLPTMIFAQYQYAAGQETLANVNGSPITRLHIEEEKRLLNASMSLDSQRDLNKQGDISDSDLLEHLIDRELMMQKAMAKQIKIHARHVDDALKTLKTRFRNASGYRQYLYNINMTELQLSEHLRTGLMVKRYLQSEVLRKVRVSDAELRSFYTQHPEDFILPNQVRALHLLLAVTDEDQRGETLIKMQAIERQLNQGADFAATVLENSDCPSRTKGGDLGYFTYNQVIPVIAEVAFALQPGQISHIVESPLGYHLIKVIDRKPPSPVAFKDVRNKIERTIRRNKENRAVETHMAGLRKGAEIVRYPISP